jgi:hypothetical protein
MSFQIFDCPDPAKLDKLVAAGPTKHATLERLAAEIDQGLPAFLIEYIKSAMKNQPPGTLAIHPSSSIEGYKQSADQETISRAKGFIGNPQLELGRFPNAIHHVKILYNAKRKARVFYKNQGGAQFVQNLKS